MSRGERAARVERAKHLGRAAYRLARAGDIVGNCELDGEEKRVTEHRGGRLTIELAAPLRADAYEFEWSRLRVMWDGARVLELRWDRVGSFRVLQISDGEWQETLTRLVG